MVIEAVPQLQMNYNYIEMLVDLGDGNDIDSIGPPLEMTTVPNVNVNVNTANT